jgi:hypothetical protein
MNFILSNRKTMGLNPASINMDTGIVTINKDIWKELSPVQKKLILLHEKAHFVLQTVDDEIACDKWAIEHYAGSEKYSLRKSLDAFYELLNAPYISLERKYQIVISCLTVDAEKFGNKRSKALLDEIENDKSKDANWVDIAVAVVAIAGTLISLGSKYLWGKKNMWKQESGKKRTPIRDEMTLNFVRVVIGKEMQRMSSLGYEGQELLDKISDYCKNYNKVASDAFAQMVSDNFFVDNNIATKSWTDYQKFISDKYYSWFPQAVAEHSEATYQEIRAAMEKQMGIGSGVLSSIPKWAIWAVVAVVGIFIIKKIRK